MLRNNYNLVTPQATGPDHPPARVTLNILRLCHLHRSNNKFPTHLKPLHFLSLILTCGHIDIVVLSCSLKAILRQYS